MLFIFVSIIVVAAILYLVAFLMKRKNDERLKKLEERKIALFDLPVIEEVDEVKKMHLVGQSQNTFREWNQKWSDISTTSFAELESRIFEAESLNDTFRFLKVKQAVDEAYETMEEMEREVNQVRAGLKELRESEKTNSLDVQKALDAYEEIAKDVHDNGEKFGPALKELEKRVNKIETEFTQFVALNTSGDPMEARSVLTEAEEKTYELKATLEKVPPLYKDLNEVFPEQIKEIDEGYAKLKAENYQFSNNFVGEELAKVKKLQNNTLKELEKCEISIVEENNLEIDKKIDCLYSEMEKEMDAKTYVSKNQSKINDYLRHVQRNNRQLIIELDHTSQSYTLNHNELGTSRTFQTQIEEIQKQNLEVEEKLTDQTAVFSEVKSFYEEMFQYLGDIEKEQITIDQSIQKLRTDEKHALAKVDEFEFKLRTMKRYIEKYRLPGIPADYLEFFFVATDRVEELSQELNKLRIDMDHINDLVGFCQDDIQLLEQKTNELVDSAALTEQMLQYANRFKHTHPAIQGAMDRTLELFDKEYRYQDALEEIRSALELTEPGAPKRIESFYYHNREIL